MKKSGIIILLALYCGMCAAMEKLITIHEVAATGNKSELSSLLAKKIKVDEGDSQGKTPLHYAAARGDAEIVELLIARAKEQTEEESDPQYNHRYTPETYREIWFPVKLTGSDKQGKTPLHYAAEQGHENVARMLLEAGSSVDAKDQEERTPLHYAVTNRHASVINQLLSHIELRTKKEIENRYYTPETPNYAEVLLQAKRTILRTGDKKWQSPLHYAAQQGYEEGVKLLIQAGAEITHKDREGRMPLHFAAAIGWAEGVKLFLVSAEIQAKKSLTETGCLYDFEKRKEITTVNEAIQAFVNTRDKKKQTALHLAAKQGCEDVVKLLIAAGADTKLKDFSKNKPLDLARKWPSIVTLLEKMSIHEAAEAGKVNEVSSLLTSGVKVDVRDEDQKTPLHFAAAQCRAEVVTLLLEKADTQAKGEATDKEGKVNTELYFQAKKAIINAKDDCWKTPLHLAAQYGEASVVLLLLEAGAEIKQKDTGQNTALHYAAEYSFDKVELLLAKAASIARDDVKAPEDDKTSDVELRAKRTIIDAKDGNGRTPLHRAAYRGADRNLMLLIQAGAHVNVKDLAGDTALHVAAKRGKKETVTLLLKANTDTNAHTQWDPVFHEVAVLGDIDMVQLLLDAKPSEDSKKVALIRLLGVTDFFEEKNIKPRNDEKRYENYLKIIRLLIEAGVDLKELSESQTIKKMIHV